MPLFPELYVELRALFESEAGEGAEFVINHYREATQNLRTTFAKIVKRAGLTLFPRPFDNMRMTRSNEVYRRWGAFKESEWIGHSRRVREDHYLIMTEDDFREAAKHGAGEEKGGRKADQNLPAFFPAIPANFPAVRGVNDGKGVKAVQSQNQR